VEDEETKKKKIGPAQERGSVFLRIVEFLITPSIKI
jgi:hypothetical protein